MSAGADNGEFGSPEPELLLPKFGPALKFTPHISQGPEAFL